MRRLLLILLIALLPVRALAGDWMMLGVPGCEMHLAQAGEQSIGEEPSSPSTDAQCAACDLCVPAASSPASAHGALFALAQSLRAVGGGEFASAALSRDLRPPAL